MRAKTIKINEGFVCLHCHEEVTPANKTCRNHCPCCLWSLHVDSRIPGDRLNACRGLMEPLYIEKKGKGWIITHRCAKCGGYCSNQVAEDDAWNKIIELSQFTPFG